MKRCFIALDIPEDVKESIVGAVRNFTREVNRVGNVKFVKKDNMHVTLKFLGNVGESSILKIHEELTTLFSNKREISCELHAKLGVFPNEKYVRVVWIGIESNNMIEELMREVDVNMTKLGFSKERSYIPHITLARVKSVNDREKLAELIKGVEIPKLKFTINNASLYESILKHDGPVYVKLHEYKLGGQVDKREG